VIPIKNINDQSIRTFMIQPSSVIIRMAGTSTWDRSKSYICARACV